jgi:hypothetical protein
MVFARARVIVVLALAAAACTDVTAETTAGSPATDPIISIENDGGDMEGHTPTGFAGSDTGLFVGDNLNPSFPEGEGVQTYLTFALPGDVEVDRALLTSNVLTTAGTPFDDLGALLAEPVVYEAFGPALFDLVASGAAVACRVVGDSSVECDVTAAVRDAVADGRDTVQVRLRFERPADNDGQADLAMFHRSNSNTNEAGLFTLDLANAP